MGALEDLVAHVEKRWSSRYDWQRYLSQRTPLLIMHEWALAEAVASFVSERVKKPKKVWLKMGELQNVDGEIFLSALQELMSSVSVVLQREDCLLLCNVCKKEWGLSALSEEEREIIHFLPEAVHAYSSCPFCGSRDFSVEKGRGVTVERMEGCDGP